MQLENKVAIVTGGARGIGLAIAKRYAAERQAGTPPGRIGNPEEIASIAVFLASGDSSYINSQTVYADGGRLGLNYVMPVPDEATE